jgi:hypothetical protein
MPLGWALDVGTTVSVTMCEIGVIDPIRLPAFSVNHSAPSLPTVIPWGFEPP